MLDKIKKLLGLGETVDFGALLANGALIIDVRTPGEYAQGHIKTSINVPLANISDHMQTMKRGKPVITCCASGIRSRSAMAILKANGFAEVYNGGSWMNLKKYEKQ